MIFRKPKSTLERLSKEKVVRFNPETGVLIFDTTCYPYSSEIVEETESLLRETPKIGKVIYVNHPQDIEQNLRSSFGKPYYMYHPFEAKHELHMEVRR